MNTAIVSSIIGTVGAGFIAVLVVYLQGLRDDIRAVHARIGDVESGLGGIAERLVRMEATQEEHGRLLAGIADHGERIATVEGAVAAMS